jgi:hypothetical protein
MKIALIAAAVGMGLGLVGCATEAKISLENDQARKICFDAGLHTTDKQFWPCQVSNRNRLEAENDTTECKAKGLQPGSPAMSQCLAELKKQRSAQYSADYTGYMHQMGM